MAPDVADLGTCAVRRGRWGAAWIGPVAFGGPGGLGGDEVGRGGRGAEEVGGGEVGGGGRGGGRGG